MQLALNLRVGSVIGGAVEVVATGSQRIVLSGVNVQMVFQRGVVTKVTSVDLDPQGVVGKRSVFVVVWTAVQPPLGCISEMRVVYRGVKVASATYDSSCVVQ